MNQEQLELVIQQVLLRIKEQESLNPSPEPWAKPAVFVVGNVSSRSVIDAKTALSGRVRVVGEISAATHVLVPDLPLFSVGNLAALVTSSDDERLILKALTDGRPVFVCGDPVAAFPGANPALAKAFGEAKKKTQAFGLVYTTLPGFLALITNLDRRKLAGGVGSKKLYTEGDILALLPGTTLAVGSALITPLAMDAIKAKNIVVRRCLAIEKEG